MLSYNILSRVFLLKSGNGHGSGFTIEFKGRQLLITAKHVLPVSPRNHSIEIWHKTGWQEIPIDNAWYAQEPLDLAAFALNAPISPTFEIGVGGQSFISQDVYFLGFPFEFKTDAYNINNGFPVPFVKKGILAGITSIGSQASAMFYLDAMNNPGFSGGPVVFVEGKDKPNVFAVVNSRQFERSPVFKGETESEYYTLQNTGLMACTPISTALEFLEKGGFRY